MACWCSCSTTGASVGQEVMILGERVAVALGGLADGEFGVSIDLSNVVSPQCPVVGQIWSKWRG